MNAYNFNKRKDILEQLLDLNFDFKINLLNGEDVLSPGLPNFVKNKSEFVTEDCIQLNNLNLKTYLKNNSLCQFYTKPYGLQTSSRQYNKGA